LHLHILGGSKEGGQYVLFIGILYGISPGTASNYFSHASYDVKYALKEVEPARVSLPSSLERLGTHGLVRGFPNCVAYADGYKQKGFRPQDEIEQERIYDGHHKFHSFGVLVWVEVHRSTIRLDFTIAGSTKDRGIFNYTVPMQSPHLFFDDGEHCIADYGFIDRFGLVLCQFKMNQGLEYEFSAEWNRDIRTQRIIVNEWGIGYIKNRMRLFLGRWPFADYMFEVCYINAARMVN